ncbi:MAG: hypothetical protein OXC54_04200 [Rhodospirillaceae bacterium]|nr:hypothetical protein [Rhodospirillaceae bacterium]
MARVLASKAQRSALRDRRLMRQAARDQPLRQSEKRFNRLVSKRRFRVKQCFDAIKRLLSLHRAQLAIETIGQNLIKTENRITLNSKIPVVA